MEIYAKNFPMPAYLAFLDAICDWEAPVWVYDHIEPVPDIDSIEEFRIRVCFQNPENARSGFWKHTLVFMRFWHGKACEADI